MQHILRPYASAGVVLAGAGLIAVTPMAINCSDIQARAVRLMSTGSVFDIGDFGAALAVAPDQAYPIITPDQLLTNTIDNLESLNTQIAADPSPILDQILINQAAYSNDLATAFANASQDFTSEMQDLSTGLQNAAADLASGNVYEALYNDVWQTLLSDQLAVTNDLTTGMSQVAQGIADNIFNVVNDTYDYGDAVSGTTPDWLVDLIQAPLFAPNAAMAGIAGVSQDIVTAANNGDYTTVFSDLLNAPSTITDAFLNGYPQTAVRAMDVGSDLLQRLFNLDPGFGLLTADGFGGGFRGGGFENSGGTIESILAAEQNIAANLGAGEPVAKMADLLSGASDTTWSADFSTLLGDLSSALDPSTLLADVTGLFDPSVVSDLGAQLTADLGPDLSTLLLSLF